MNGFETIDPELVAQLARPLKIRGRQVANRLWLAPMAGLGHVAFREVLDGYGGCGLLFTEMCTARGLPTEKPSRSSVFRWREEELPRLVCQLMGGDPREMAEAAKRVEREGFFGVDVNMGCSVSGVVKRHAGADLLRHPDRAEAVVRAIREAVDIPMFVKFRTGWDSDPSGAVALARRFQEIGVDCLVFHPRVAPDRRTRPPELEHIRLVREAVDIPVIGNGNVCLPDDCARMLEATGCHGVSIGRMAVARPWLFAEWTGLGVPESDNPYLDLGLRVCDSLERHYDPTRAIKLYRKFLIYYAANFAYGHSLLSRLGKGTTMGAMRENLCELVRPDMSISRRPNALLFS
ncbi:tRNA dihydrouridine synthase [Pseudodesulfovibrio tunisiensis]|uniref:tRNA dihydrouridine synthase n=1 Tax=Pseudodesulfovibrio tunisiensis TaxID=463192 RepID=UPI001FB53D2D|nr:tRNA-dihydrouridine synthase family protein [Pseudodesulfovibrio tunisiensis]